jgi:hypothetical protein
MVIFSMKSFRNNVLEFVMRLGFALAAVIILSGCAMSNQQMLAAQIREQFKLELEVNEKAMVDSGQKCGWIDDIEAYDKKGDRKAASKILSCIRSFVYNRVRPYTKYPDLYEKLHKFNQSTLKEYSNGNTDLNGYFALVQQNYNKYSFEIDKKIVVDYQPMIQQAAQMDAVAAQQAAARSAAMSQLGAQMMKDTNQNTNMTCNRFGDTMNCNTW